MDSVAVGWNQLQSPAVEIRLANVARPVDEKKSKKAATKVLANLLLDRWPSDGNEAEAAQDLQELYKVPRSDQGSALGAYWKDMCSGKKVLGDKTLARCAHEAVMRGHLTARDYPTLFVTDGGIRLLQAIGNVLIEQNASGGTLDPEAVRRNWEAWEAARCTAVKRRQAERKAIRERLKSAKADLDRALRSVEKLLNVIRKSQYIEISQPCLDAACELDGETPSPCPSLLFRKAVESLKGHLIEGSGALAAGSVQERDFRGYANLPSFMPRGEGVDASRETLRKQAFEALDILDKDPRNDDDGGEIVVEDVGDCTELLLAGSTVPLVWVRRQYKSKRGTAKGAVVASKRTKAPPKRNSSSMST